MVMRILFVHKRLLFPSDNGGKIRTLNTVRHLARWHDVTYLCNERPEDAPYVDAMKALGVRLVTLPWNETPRWTFRFYGELFRNLFSLYPYNVDKNYDPALRAKIQELLRNEDFDLLICDFVQMSRNVLGLDGPPKLLFQHNVEAEIFERHAATDRGWLRRWYMGRQAAKMRRFEAGAGREFARVVAVSRRDAAEYRKRYGWDHVDVIDTAVDTEFFHPMESAEIIDGRVVFVGSMDWLPNIDGMEWFVRRIWPLVLKRIPTAALQIVGRNPPATIRAFDGTSNVEVTGTVDDVRPYLAGAAVVVVPLRIGGGTRLKIYEALAMEKAMVSTHLGAEGLPLEHERHLLLHDEAQKFAAAVVRLIEDGELRGRLAKEARRFVVDNFRAEVVARQFEAICYKAAGISSSVEGVH